MFSLVCGRLQAVRLPHIPGRCVCCVAVYTTLVVDSSSRRLEWPLSVCLCVWCMCCMCVRCSWRCSERCQLAVRSLNTLCVHALFVMLYTLMYSRLDILVNLQWSLARLSFCTCWSADAWVIVISILIDSWHWLLTINYLRFTDLQ